MTEPRVFVLDNYDSFTFNLVQLLGRIGADVTVARNDEVSVAEVRDRQPDAIVISPGPSRPEKAGISVELVRALGPSVPLLGVCLGHQAIGGRLWRLGRARAAGPRQGLGRSTTHARARSPALTRRSRRRAITRWPIDRDSASRRARGHRVERGRGGDGHSSSVTPGGGLPVPPGVDPDR